MTGMGRRRARVLVSAFAMSPRRGSEAAVGWQICSRLGLYHDVTVLFAAKDHKLEYEEEVAAFIASNGPIPGVEFRAVQHPWVGRVFGGLHDVGIWPAYYAEYAAWQAEAFRVAKGMHAECRFDLIHHLNMIGYREPGFLWKLDPPFVWGPIGGAALVPLRYTKCLGMRGTFTHGMRNIANAIQMRILRRVRHASKKASRLWVVGDAEARMVNELWGCRSEFMLETGTEIRVGAVAKEFDGTRPLRIAWSGSLDPHKGLPVLLAALACLPRDVRWELFVLGEGREAGRWGRVAAEFGIDQEIRWLGRQARTKAVEILGSADCLAFTGLKGGTSNVVVEALSQGVPVVCHDAYGFGRAVTAECGIKIPMRGETESIAGFASAIERLYREAGLVRRLSEGALKRATELSWDEKATVIANAYDEVLTSL